MGLHGVRGSLDGLYDVVIAGASTVVALQRMANVIFTRTRITAQQIGSRHDHARCAETALQRVFLAEGDLQRVKLASRHTFYRGYRPAIGLHRKHGAGLDAFTVNMHVACPALARVASYMRTGQPQRTAQKINQQRAWLNLCLLFLTVNGNLD